MSSFFSSLISRSLAPVAQVAPRPVARFESVGTGLGLPPDAPADLKEEHVFQAADRPRREEHARAPLGAHADTPAGSPVVTPPAAMRVSAPDEPWPAQVARETLHAPVAPVTKLVSVTQPAQASAPPPPAAAALPGALPRALDLPPRAVHPADSGPAAAREHPLNGSEPPPVQPATRAPVPQMARERPAPLLEDRRAPEVPAAVPHSPEALRPAERPDAAPPQALRPALLVQPQIALAPPREAAPRQETLPVPAPVIQVTIGRIEVRAAPAPARPERPRAASATMSLEEYLRQRSNGGSR